MKTVVSPLITAVLLASMIPMISSSANATEDPAIRSKLEAACKKHERLPWFRADFFSQVREDKLVYFCRELSGVDDEDERYFKIACKNTPGYLWWPNTPEDSLHTGQCFQK